MSDHYQQADYAKESNFWLNVKPLRFNKTDTMRWGAVDQKGRKYAIIKHAKKGAAYLHHSMPRGREVIKTQRYFEGDSALTALAHGSDHSVNGFQNVKEASQFASFLAATPTPTNFVAAIYLAPHAVDWKLRERGVYTGRFGTNGMSAYEYGSVRLENKPSGWVIESLRLSGALRDRHAQLPDPNAILHTQFSTKKQAAIAAGLFVRDLVNKSSFYVRKEHLVPFLGRNLTYSSGDSFKKFDEILNAVSHTGWCRDTFEATVYAEAARATKGYPQPDDCLSAALMLLRAYSEAK